MSDGTTGSSDSDPSGMDSREEPDIDAEPSCWNRLFGLDFVSVTVWYTDVES